MKLWSLKGKKILIVDDYQEMRGMLRAMIEPLAPDLLQTARNGEEAVEMCEQNRFDIVFCDYNLGKGKDGQQVLEEVKTRSLLPYSAIYIMVTAENTVKMVMGALDYLPDDYLSKPFNRVQLQSRLNKLMDKKHSLIDISRAIAEKNYALGIALCDRQLAKKPRNRLELLKTKGELLVNTGSYDEAMALYEEVIEAHDIPWAALAIGRVNFYQQRYHEAEAVFREIIADNEANVAAYDWLAKTLDALQEFRKSQAVLATAIEKSPKSLNRQRRLADTAYRNNDFAVAQTAYENAVEVGRNSCFRKPDDYSCLAKTLIRQHTPDAALGVIERMSRAFSREDTDVEFQAAVMSGLVYGETGDAEARAQAVQKALSLFEQNPERVSNSLVMDLAESSLASGQQEAAAALVKHLVQNNHEDQDIVDRANALYEQAGVGDVGRQLIEQARSEVIRINNDGARLAREGKLEESIELFMEAARGMPNNTVVNLNAAYSMIMQMQNTGKLKKYFSRTMGYLENVRRLEPSNPKYHRLLSMMHELKQKAA